MKSAIREALDKLGGVSVVQRALELSRQAIYDWDKKGIPVKYLRAVSEVSGVPLEKLLAESEQYYGVDYKACLKALQSEVRRAEKRSA